MVPAATARLLTERVATMTVLAAALGALGGWVGLAISYEASLQQGVRLAAGATIVVVLVGFFLVALAASALIDRGGPTDRRGPTDRGGSKRPPGPPRTGGPHRAPGPPRGAGAPAGSPRGASGSAR
jgi:manganese/iron transport system permease protein